MRSSESMVLPTVEELVIVPALGHVASQVFVCAILLRHLVKIDVYRTLHNQSYYIIWAYLQCYKVTATSPQVLVVA